jgi:hypothetical protein
VLVHWVLAVHRMPVVLLEERCIRGRKIRTRNAGRLEVLVFALAADEILDVHVRRVGLEVLLGALQHEELTDRLESCGWLKPLAVQR